MCVCERERGGQTEMGRLKETRQQGCASELRQIGVKTKRQRRRKRKRPTVYICERSESERDIAIER